MKTIKLGGREYDVGWRDTADYDTYRARLRQAAMKLDEPLARFTAKLKGVSDADRAAAITGFVQSRGWDEPPEELIANVEYTRGAMCMLALRVCQPRMTPAEVEAAVTDDNWQQVYADLREALRPLTDEDIMAANAKLKERILKQQQSHE